MQVWVHVFDLGPCILVCFCPALRYAFEVDGLCLDRLVGVGSEEENQGELGKSHDGIERV